MVALTVHNTHRPSVTRVVSTYNRLPPGVICCAIDRDHGASSLQFSFKSGPGQTVPLHASPGGVGGEILNNAENTE